MRSYKHLTLPLLKTWRDKETLPKASRKFVMIFAYGCLCVKKIPENITSVKKADIGLKS